ncbi:MAG: hypothetical protein AB4352_27175 [Hormoscilla sp.]
MYAIEFEATIEDGMIRIPQEYLAQLQPRLKVIVLQEESGEKQEALKQKDEFLAKVAQHRFDLPPDYRFNREELYDRI